jgi:hypothetical protein
MNGALCSRCNERESATYHAWCRECRNEYMRATRPRYKELSAEEKRKISIRGCSNMLVFRGRLRREPCRECGAKAEKHHPDYTNARLVVWLCRACHRRLHRQERDAAFAALVRRRWPDNAQRRES